MTPLEFLSLAWSSHSFTHASSCGFADASSGTGMAYEGSTSPSRAELTIRVNSGGVPKDPLYRLVEPTRDARFSKAKQSKARGTKGEQQPIVPSQTSLVA